MGAIRHASGPFVKYGRKGDYYDKLFSSSVH